MKIESGMVTSAALLIFLQTGSTGGLSYDDHDHFGRLSHTEKLINEDNANENTHSPRNDADLVAVRYGCSFTGSNIC